MRICGLICGLILVMVSDRQWWSVTLGYHCWTWNAVCMLRQVFLCGNLLVAIIWVLIHYLNATVMLKEFQNTWQNTGKGWMPFHRDHFGCRNPFVWNTAIDTTNPWRAWDKIRPRRMACQFHFQPWTRLDSGCSACSTSVDCPLTGSCNLRAGKKIRKTLGRTGTTRAISMQFWSFLSSCEVISDFAGHGWALQSLTRMVDKKRGGKTALEANLVDTTMSIW